MSEVIDHLIVAAFFVLSMWSGLFRQDYAQGSFGLLVCIFYTIRMQKTKETRE